MVKALGSAKENRGKVRVEGEICTRQKERGQRWKEEKGKEWDFCGGKGKDLEFIHTQVVIHIMGLDHIYKDVSILKARR